MPVLGLPPFTVSRCSNLQTLSISDIYFRRWSSDDPKQRITQFPSDLTSTNIKRTTLEIFDPGQGGLDPKIEWMAGVDWHGINALLTHGSHFGNLERVWIEWVMMGQSKRSEVKEFLDNGSLSSLRECGILKYRIVREWPCSITL